MKITNWILEYLDKEFPKGLERGELLAKMAGERVYKRSSLSSELSYLTTRGLIKVEHMGRKTILYPLFKVRRVTCSKCGETHIEVARKEETNYA